MRTMKAVVIDPDQRRVILADRPVPEPGPGEALVRVRLAGICGTDLEMVQGYMRFAGVPGHEFVGKVERCDSAPQWVGRRVVGEINAACGACEACAKGHGRHCPTRTVMGILGRDGAMATHCVLPVANLHEVPAHLGDEHAVFAEPIAAALEVAETAHVKPSHEVLMLGDGRLAQAIGQVLLLIGCDLTVAGKHRNKLDILQSRGARTVAHDEIPDRKWDIVVEATGSPDGPAQALARCRPLGTVCLKSTVAAGAGIPVVPTIVDEIRVVGSRCGPFAPALRLLASGRIEVAPLISGVWPLEKAPEAFVFAQSREVLKVLLDASM
jgi:threonine dehydrogenase-like Zn-dependent dehydrogenase